MPAPSPGPGATPVADGLLRPALELAFDVARVGARSSPALEPPRMVRPFLSFTGRLPDAALVALRRGLDDEAFRSRVAGLADEDELGRAGWLFLVRPDGWDGELASLSAEAEARARAEREEREERSARRRLTHAEEATQRAEAAATRAAAELATVAAELTAERRERRVAREEAAQLARRVASVEGERDSARRKAGESSAEAERLRAELEGLQAELERVKAAAGALQAEAEAEALRARADRLRAEAAGRKDGVTRSTGADGGAGAGLEGAGASASPAGAGRRAGRADAGTDAAGPDVPAVVRAVAAAAAAASALGRALEEASAALAPASAPGDAAAGTAGAPAGPSSSLRSAGSAPARRRPSGLPPAVFDDTPEAAAHLIRVPGVLVLIDGYNAAKALWPDVAPLELRERLVDALSELVARTGAGVHVVYDGADIGLPQSRPIGRGGVRISFSPPDVEADDVILDLVDAAPLDRPVVVASSDRRVQDGARQRGANVISSAQLAAVLGRS